MYIRKRWNMNSILLIIVTVAILVISAIAAIILDDIYCGKEDYINELEKKVKK
jgi:hypothetical protein